MIRLLLVLASLSMASLVSAAEKEFSPSPTLAAVADTVKMCFGGNCVLAVKSGSEAFLYTADVAKFQEIKRVDQNFPLKLTSQAYYASAMAKAKSVEYSPDDLKEMEEDLAQSRKTCKRSGATCALAVGATLFELFVEKNPVKAFMAYAGAVYACDQAIDDCTVYWRRMKEYEKLQEAQEKAKEDAKASIEREPTPSTNPSTSTGGVTGTSPITPIPDGSTISTDMPSGGWGSPVSTVPILPEHNR